ncbi:MAG: hypothetical protein K6G50_07695 [bacterium]|nr:hypothetical protein [bacterium]
MRKCKLRLFILAFIAAALLSAMPAQAVSWRDGLQAMSRLQAMIEYYFIETGAYPSSLEALERSFNKGLPEEAVKVKIPVDPISSQPFVYKLSPDRRVYLLSLPDPSLYGNNAFELRPVDWAWMAEATRLRRMERVLLDCTHSMELIANRIELYAKDHENVFPDNLAALRPRYMPKALVCPGCGLEYVYERKGKGYLLSCPEPIRHGLKTFTYDSEKGLKVEEAVPGEAKDAKAPEAPSSPPANKAASPEKAPAKP